MNKWMASILVLIMGVIVTVTAAMADADIPGIHPAIVQIKESLTAANTYYVDNNNPNASDSNPGSEEAPWLTIQHAADVALPGDTILVKQGQYDERVFMQNSGITDARIIFRASPRRSVIMQGFHLDDADNIRIEGFRITNSLTSWADQFGIYINGDYNEIVDNEFYEMKASAIRGGDLFPSYNYIANNYIYHSQMGITMNGQGWIVENNEVERLFMYEGDDCDYMRFFGYDHVIQGNFLYGTDFNEVGDAHVDCFQTYDVAGEDTHNVLIEDNTCFVFTQGFMGSANTLENSSHVTLRNNVFAHGRGWVIYVTQIDNVTLENNTFYDVANGAGFREASLNNVVINNIFYDMGNSYWTMEESTLSGDYNLIFEANEPPQMGPHDILGLDPLLADPANHDFHLQENSPAIDAGQTLTDVSSDLEGTSRPQGNGYDIGAYEFGAPSPTFQDVPLDHWAYEYIETLYQNGYIAGCSLDPKLYCPDDILTRAESAVFIVRGVHGAEFMPPDPSEKTFDDIALTEWYAKWGTQLWNDGYTAGCGIDPLIYCPLQEHTIAEGSVFYLRMKNGANYEPSSPSGIFIDVPIDAWYARWVEDAYRQGILLPCQTEPQLLACPERPLDRAMAARMMYIAKELAPQ